MKKLLFTLAIATITLSNAAAQRCPFKHKRSNQTQVTISVGAHAAAVQANLMGLHVSPEKSLWSPMGSIEVAFPIEELDNDFYIKTGLMYNKQGMRFQSSPSKNVMNLPPLSVRMQLHHLSTECLFGINDDLFILETGPYLGVGLKGILTARVKQEGFSTINYELDPYKPLPKELQGAIGSGTGEKWESLQKPLLKRVDLGWRYSIGFYITQSLSIRYVSSFGFLNQSNEKGLKARYRNASITLGYTF